MPLTLKWLTSQSSMNLWKPVILKGYGGDLILKAIMPDQNYTK